MKLDFTLPTRLFTGKGCFKENAASLTALGKKALIVTGRTSAVKSGALDDVKDALSSVGISYALFDKIEQNPTFSSCKEASLAALREGAGIPWAGAVLDADALNALAAGKYRGDLPANTILTPHPGEAARLLGLTVPDVQADREGAAVSLAEKYHCVAVLKGHHTLIAAPDGTVWRNETGNAGLAKGGSGDILAGLTAGLLAAGLKQGRTPEDAAVCAVWLHGAAADRCARRRSMTAMLPGDLFEDLGWSLGELGR